MKWIKVAAVFLMSTGEKCQGSEKIHPPHPRSSRKKILSNKNQEWPSLSIFSTQMPDKNSRRQVPLSSEQALPSPSHQGSFAKPPHGPTAENKVILPSRWNHSPGQSWVLGGTTIFPPGLISKLSCWGPLKKKLFHHGRLNMESNQMLLNHGCFNKEIKTQRHDNSLAVTRGKEEGAL